MRGGDANRQRLSRFLPPHPLIHHQGHATLELHNGLGRDGFDLGNIQMESVMQQREHLALHARRDHSLPPRPREQKRRPNRSPPHWSRSGSLEAIAKLWKE